MLDNYLLMKDIASGSRDDKAGKGRVSLVVLVMAVSAEVRGWRKESLEGGSLLLIRAEMLSVAARIRRRKPTQEGEEIDEGRGLR